MGINFVSNFRHTQGGSQGQFGDAAGLSLHSCEQLLCLDEEDTDALILQMF